MQELGEGEGLPTVYWPPVKTCCANIYDHHCLRPLVLSYFFLYCIFRNESWQLKSYQRGYCTDLWVFISKRAIPWLVTEHKSAAVAAALAHLRRTCGIKWQTWEARLHLRTVEDFCPIFGDLGAQPRVLFQPAGAGLIHLIKTDLMIETKALFITLDFHTRHDSRLFHLRSFICRNEEWVPIFKLTLPYFLLYKWPGMLFLSFTSKCTLFISFIEPGCCEHRGNKGSCYFVPYMVHLHSESWMTVGFVLTITRESGTMWKNTWGWF